MWKIWGNRIAAHTHTCLQARRWLAKRIVCDAHTIETLLLPECLRRVQAASRQCKWTACGEVARAGGLTGCIRDWMPHSRSRTTAAAAARHIRLDEPYTRRPGSGDDLRAAHEEPYARQQRALRASLLAAADHGESLARPYDQALRQVRLLPSICRTLVTILRTAKQYSKSCSTIDESVSNETELGAFRNA